MFRIGSGHDTHRLQLGRPLILGGVTIDYAKGLYGHSDADVVLHAITDALLGAAGMGDIGDMFPDTRPQALLDMLVITAVSALVHDRQHNRWEPPRLWGRDRDAWEPPPELSPGKAS